VQNTGLPLRKKGTFSKWALKMVRRGSKRGCAKAQTQSFVLLSGKVGKLPGSKIKV
jgi:hypothetical protein